MGSKKKNRKAKDKDAPSLNGASGGNLVTDPRFSLVHSDPRFQKVPRRESKVAIDSRFQPVFTDKRFGSSSAPLDKRGKRRKGKSSRDSMREYYRIEENDEEKVKESKKEESDEEIQDGSENGNEENVKSGGKSLLLPENPTDDEEGSEESEEEFLGKAEAGGSTSESETEEEDDEMLYGDEGPEIMEEDVPEIEKETRRLAVVNMDWRYVSASDLYVLLASFLPKDGHIVSVAVYPSEYGLQRMKEEELHGPVGLFDDEKRNKDKEDEEEKKDDDVKVEKDEEDEDDEVEDEDDEEEDEDEEKEEEDDEEEEDEDVTNKRFRAYELSKLRYFYAVVECDSSATADYLYKACDGVEFERSSNKLDLRFIPDSMEFKDHPPRDVATEAPANYEGADFHSRALQMSTVGNPWDEDEPHRVKSLKRKFNADQMAVLELNEFLASDESESDDNGNEGTEDKREKKKNKYRALIQGGEDGSDEDEEGGHDMEVTFNTGLEDLSKHIQEKKNKESETVWEGILRKSREKKKSRKNRSNKSSSDEGDNDGGYGDFDNDQNAMEQPDDFFVEAAPVKKKKEGKQKQDTEKETADEASRAELELLLADDKTEDAGVKGYNLKRKKAKGKKGEEEVDEGKIPAGAYDDPRFSDVFNSHLFSLDPTDPQFKRSATYARQVAQKQKGIQRDLERVEDRKPRTETTKDEDAKRNLISGKHDLSAGVRSIKMKLKQNQLRSNRVAKKNKTKPA